MDANELKKRFHAMDSGWKRANAVIQNEKRNELKHIRTSDVIRSFSGLLEKELARGLKPRMYTGLIEQQKLFMQYHERTDRSSG